MSEKQPDAKPTTEERKPIDQEVTNIIEKMNQRIDASAERFEQKHAGIAQDTVDTLKEWAQYLHKEFKETAKEIATQELEEFGADYKLFIRKAVGMPVDAPLMRGEAPLFVMKMIKDNPEWVRKALLEVSTPEKRSPTAATSTTPGPDGIQRGEANEIDQAFNETLSSLGVAQKDVKP